MPRIVQKVTLNNKALVPIRSSVMSLSLSPRRMGKEDREGERNGEKEGKERLRTREKKRVKNSGERQ